MKRSEFEARLHQLRTTPSEAHARMLADGMCEAASRVDAVLRGAFCRALEKRGLPAPRIDPVALRSGETWLLLFEAPSQGWAVRLRAYPGPLREDDSLLPEVRRARRGLVSAAARACRRLEHSRHAPIDIDSPFARFEIEGSSLGLSVAVATLSAELRRPPALATAGSAQVDEEGRLRPVEHLSSKLDALHRSWPEVTRVVVAKGQGLPRGYRSPVEIVEVEHLEKALPYFDLSLEDLPQARLDAYQRRVDSLRNESNAPHESREWTRLSLEAVEAAAALAADDPERSSKAYLWAALFAVHSGDPGAAAALLRRVSDEVAKPYPELYARKLIASASAEIDAGDLERASALAARAAELCADLAARDRRELLGQALGTRGRALMHGGDLIEAEHQLRRALEHHRSHVETAAEVPRSACYLGTCLRLAGRPDEAVDVVDEALSRANALSSKWDVAVTTRLFLHLERGRIHLAAGRWKDAAADFQIVKDGQLSNASYPRLGAVRGLARALRELGESDEAERALVACLDVARDRSGKEPILEQVAAIAAGEALLDAAPTSVPRGELEAVWTAAFGEDRTPSRIASVIRGWIY